MRSIDCLHRPLRRLMAIAAISMTPAPVLAQDKPVYRCPGPPVLYTDAVSASEARDRNCKVIEGSPVTVVPATRPRAPAIGSNPTASSPPGASSRGTDARVDPAEQRARDSDARRILTEELRREDERLAALRKEFNNGEPERRGEERNYQKYLDRVAEMRAAILRKEGDVAALRRELSKFPP